MLASSAMAGATSQRKKEKKKKIEDIKMRSSKDLKEYVENDKVTLLIHPLYMYMYALIYIV
jgi:hypothetical protein